MQAALNNPGIVDMTAIADALIDTGLPAPEKTGGAGGTQTKAQGAGHQHPRATSTTIGTVATGNTASLLFTRSFVSEPGINYSELPPTGTTTTPTAGDTNAGAQPSTHKVIAWTMGPTTALPDAAAGTYTGCTIRVWRSQTVPQNLATLLLGAVFNLFAASVVGTRFSIIAVARSDVSSS